MRNRVILFLFLATFGYFLLGGIFSYQLANHFVFQYHDFGYNIDLWRAAVYAVVGLVAFLVAYMTFAHIHLGLRVRDEVRVEGDASVTSAHLMALVVVFGIGLLGLAAMILQYGGQIPLLSERSDEFRTQISSGLPQILYFQLVTASLLGYALLQKRMRRGRRRLIVLMTLTSLFCILLGGSRSMLFTPLLIMMVDAWMRQRVSTRKVMIGGMVSFVAIFLIGILRMGSSPEENVYLLRLAADFAPEFREFARVIDAIPNDGGYLSGQMFLNAVMILLPGKILAIIGVDKAQIWVPFGQYLKDLFQMNFLGGGLRAGIIAEYYANFGLIGISAGFYAMGMLARAIERQIRRSGAEGRIFGLLLGVSLATSVLFTFDAVFYKVAALGFGWLIYYSCVRALKLIGQSTDTNTNGNWG